MTQPLQNSQVQDDGKCRWPVHYNDQKQDWDYCNATATRQVRMPATVNLCEEHFNAYLRMINK